MKRALITGVAGQHRSILAELLLTSLRHKVQPAEIYHLADHSHVRPSFELPAFTTDVTGLGTVQLLNATRAIGLEARFGQASFSATFDSAPPPQDEYNVSPSEPVRSR